MTRLDLSITGMTCGHCLRTVDSTLRALPGVTVHQVRIGSASLSLDEAVISADRVLRAIEDAGYRATALQSAGAA